SDHFTRIALVGVEQPVVEECVDVGRLYSLIERLRIVLPLEWPDCELASALGESSPAAAAAIREHVAEFSGTVVIRTPWDANGTTLQRRLYSSDGPVTEPWSGEPLPLMKDFAVRDQGGSRTVRLVGYLLAQRRAAAGWSGVTARVQNVAVEER